MEHFSQVLATNATVIFNGFMNRLSGICNGFVTAELATQMVDYVTTVESEFACLFGIRHDTGMMQTFLIIFMLCTQKTI